MAGWWDFTPFERAIGDMALAEGREQPEPKNKGISREMGSLSWKQGTAPQPKGIWTFGDIG